MLEIYVLNKTDFINNVQLLWINSGSKPNIELIIGSTTCLIPRILWTRVLGIPDKSFHDSSLNNNYKPIGGDNLKHTTRDSGSWFGSFSTSTFIPQVFFRWGEERVCRVQCMGDHSLFHIVLRFSWFHINNISLLTK